MNPQKYDFKKKKEQGKESSKYEAFEQEIMEAKKKMDLEKIQKQRIVNKT